MLSVEWVNHASFVVRHNGKSLICDPWLEGTAFKDGWALVSPTKFSYEDFAGIDYIWFSHQHPDHFAPTNLRKIPPEVRRKITVLYQATNDRLVVNWCKSAGFGRVVELPHYEWVTLEDGVSLMCGIVDDDSWLAFKTPSAVMLNINDCVLKHAEPIERIARAVGPVDVLFTQFSYAQWTGNPPDVERRRQDAREKYNRIALQDRILKPKTIVPFASYIYFCHEENFFLNDSVNLVTDIAQFVESDLKKTPVVLYPGDVWEVGEAKPWRDNAARYVEDLGQKISAGPTHFRRPVEFGVLESTFNGFIKRLTKKNPYAKRLVTERATVYLTDAEKACELSIEGLRSSNVSANDADIVTSAENIIYALKTPWGGNTLHVSGRFYSWQNQHRRFFALMRKLHHYNVTPVNVQWVLSIAQRIARAALRRTKMLGRRRANVPV